MKELFQELIRYPWIILVVIGALWLLKHRAAIKKAGTTAVKPFREAQEADRTIEEGEPIGYEAGQLPVVK